MTRRQLLPFAALPLVHCAITFHTASTLRTVGTFDTAGYYVLARNIAMGRGLTDTVLWQLLGPPATVQTPAGGYWEVGWPLVLGSLMRVFGHSQRATIAICAVFSVLLPISTALVAHLLTKRTGPALLAGVMISLQGRILATNVAPDATAMYQIACLFGIAAFLHVHERGRFLGSRRLLLAGVAIGFPMFVRGEGFVVAAAALPLLLFTGPGPWKRRLRPILWVALGIAALSLPFAIRNLVVFGRLEPASRSLRLWMTNYKELYLFTSDPSPRAFWAQGMARLWAVRKSILTVHLDNVAAQNPWPLLPLGALGMLRHVRSQRSWVLPIFLALSLLAPCLLVPIVASFDRFCMNVLPVECVAASLGLFALYDLLARLLRTRIPGVVVLGAGLWACTVVYRGKLTNQAYVDGLGLYRETPAFLTDRAALAPLHLAPSDVVLTYDPWRVAAVLDVATVMCPFDGPVGVDALVRKYRPRFVLVSGFAPLKDLVARKSFDLRPVAQMRDGTWYELQGPVLRADGSPGRDP